MRIYVGNLSFNTDEQRLRGLFESIGSVDSVRLVRDQATGRARGFRRAAHRGETEDDEERPHDRRDRRTLAEREYRASLDRDPSSFEAAARLFSALRELDRSGAATIAVMPIPHHGLGEAINDRLRRALAARRQLALALTPNDARREP